MKNKTKLKLVGEYIFLKKVDNFCKNLNSEFDFFKEKTKRLINIYKKIFFKFGFFDLSFAVLQKELCEENMTRFDFEKLRQRLDEIETEIFVFVKKCRLNEFEKRYIVE